MEDLYFVSPHKGLMLSLRNGAVIEFIDGQYQPRSNQELELLLKHVGYGIRFEAKKRFVEPTFDRNAYLEELDNLTQGNDLTEIKTDNKPSSNVDDKPKRGRPKGS